MKWVLVLVAVCGCDKIFGLDDIPPDAAIDASAPGVWATVSVGANHACALDVTGELYCWGDATNGATASATSSTTPQHVTGVAGTWTKVAAGASHTCGVVGGNAYCWGLDDYGQLDGKMSTGGPQQLEVALPPNTPPVTDIAAGMFSTCAIAGTELWCWGQSALTTGPNSLPVQLAPQTSWSSVSVGSDHSCAIDTDGNVWCWGTNEYGQAGPFAETAVALPTMVPLAGVAKKVSAGNEASCAVLTAGGLFCWGRTTWTQLAAQAPTLIDGDNWNDVSVGSVLTCGARGGNAYCWGVVAFGGLGDGVWVEQVPPNSARPIPADTVSASHSFQSDEDVCVISSNNLSCWGDNRGGILGFGAALHATPIEVPVPPMTTWVTLASGFNHTCVVDTSNTAWCWGDDDDGQISGTACAKASCSVLTPTKFESTTAVVAGSKYTCMLTAGNVNCRGANDQNQLGVGDVSVHKSDAVVPNATELFGGAYATCANTGGSQMCWGAIGGSTSASPQTFSPPFSAAGFGRVASCTLTGNSRTCAGYGYWGDIGNTMLTQGLDSKMGTAEEGSYQTISFTQTQVCATVDHVQNSGNVGEVSCWGTNYDGESAPTTNSLVYVTSPTLVPVSASAAAAPLTGCSAVSTGHSVSCAICNGQPKCWGARRNGMLGRGGQQYAVGIPDLVSVTAETWTQIASGEAHSCALAQDGTLECWGLGVHGELGDGGHGSSLPVAIPFPN